MSVVNLLDEVGRITVWVLPHEGEPQLLIEAVPHNVGEPGIPAEVTVQICC